MGGGDKGGEEKRRRMEEDSHSPSSEGEIDVHASFDDDFLNSPSARAGRFGMVGGLRRLFTVQHGSLFHSPSSMPRC